MAKENKEELNLDDGILGMFGLTMEDVQKKNQKASDEKTGKKTGETDAGGKAKQSGKRYYLPIRICAGHLSMDIREEDDGKTMAEKDIKNRIKSRYKELSGLSIALVSFKPTKIPENAKDIKTFLKMDFQYRQIKEEEKIQFPATVLTGNYSMDVEEEKQLSEIEADWCALHSEFMHCKFYYDEKQNILVPFMAANVAAGSRYDCPIRVGYLDQIITLAEDALECDEDGRASISDIRKKFCERTDAPEYENCEFSYQEEGNLLFPIINFKRKDVKDVALPATVRIPGVTYEFEKGDFGKDVVTLEELRNKLEEYEPQYTKERTEMQYDERGFIVAILIGSRKGLKIISERKNQAKYFVEDREGNACRVEQTPYGFFSSCKDDTEFIFTGPKVPGHLLQRVQHVMRKTPGKEVALQIFFHPKEQKYHLFHPHQKGDKSSVVFDRNYERESTHVLMMDIHSHGRLPAFFSGTDDADEKGTQLYMVIGCVGTNEENYAFRAGIAGKYVPLQLEDIFDLKGGAYGCSI